jgi:putative SOS response-associated peptidase YedK
VDGISFLPMSIKRFARSCAMHSAEARETNSISQWQEIFAPRRWHRCWFHAEQIINARAETVTEKPMFRRSVAFQRCVIPATGFYEWDSAKHKYFFQMPGQPIYLAGIYDTINGVNCFIILTTAPNDSVAPIHDRMPLLLSHEQVRPWLVDAGAALELLCSRPPLLLRTSCDGQLGFDDLA